MNEKPDSKLGRRKFLGQAAAAGVVFIRPQLVRGTQANSAVRLGLLGCGARGTVVATSFVQNTNARVVALADLFADQLAAAQKHFDDLAASMGQARLDPAQLFKGAKAYQGIAASKEVDAVIIATPDYFHPEHLEAAVAAGKHVYCEKPVAVDVRGCKRVMRIGEQAQGRLSLDIGFQIRSAPPFVEMVRRIHAGALGRIASGEAYYFTRALKLPDWPNASPLERRLRQWYWDKVLSGDIIVDQNIHVLDICNWVLKAHPEKAVASGARKVRTDSGDCWDHFAAVFYYPDDVHVSFGSVQFGETYGDVCERFFGSKGVSESHYSGGVRIYAEPAWDAELGEVPLDQLRHARAAGTPFNALKDADAEKEKAFIASIVGGNYHNEAAAGAESALTAILGRTAAYTGREVTWDELLRSDHAYDAGIDLGKLP